MFRTRITFSIAKLCFIMIYLFSNLLHVCNYLYAIFLRVLMCLASLKCWSCLSRSLATCLHSLHTTSLSIQLLLLTMILLVSINHFYNVKEVSAPSKSQFVTKAGWTGRLTGALCSTVSVGLVLYTYAVRLDKIYRVF